MVEKQHAEPLAALAQVYGNRWTQDMIGHWDAPGWGAVRDYHDWIEGSMPALCRALRERGANTIADGFVDLAWRSLSPSVGYGMTLNHPQQLEDRLSALAKPLARVVETASRDSGAAIAKNLRELGEPVIALLVPLLRACEQPPVPALLEIAHDCRERLGRIAGRPQRAAQDWSISWEGCGCELCARLEEFLHAAHERSHEWKLATPGRQHIHRQIDSDGLPVQHATRRKGSPYTLVLAKTEDLFRSETERRERAQRDLSWLESTFQ